MYAHYFQGMLGGTSTTVALATTRAVEKDHALADGEQVVRGADGAVVLQIHITALLRRESGTWRLLDARPYAPLQPA